MRRLIIAGTGSGCGKTTVSLALMRALGDRGQTVQPFKVGPDYIDPGFHRAACGRVSHNLDSHLMMDKDIRLLASEAMHGADIAVIEGVMGYFDGGENSTCEMARITRAPVLLVIDAAASAESCAAVALGFAGMSRPTRIAGVIANRVSSHRHFEMISDAVKRHAGLPCIGWMQKDESLTLKSRHLGLVQAGELADLEHKIRRAAAGLHLDWDALDALTSGLPGLGHGPWPEVSGFRGFRLGIAMDEAFSFYYEANLMLLRRAGMELIPFSPLHDGALPEGLDGLYIGGGYPELFAEPLAQNEGMISSVGRALRGGMRCYAECGGLMYLTEAIDGHRMVGHFRAECRMTKRLQRFGYCNVTLDNATFPAHEFHHSELIEGDVRPAFTAAKRDSRWTCGYREGSALAQYPHAHFLSHPELINVFWGGRQ